MLGGGDSQDDGGLVGKSQTSKSTQNGQPDFMAELKTFMRNEIREGFASMENRLVHRFEIQMAEQKAEFKSDMKEMEKKIDSLVQEQNMMTKNLAAILEMLGSKATHDASFQHSQNAGPGHQFHQGARPKEDSKGVTRWPGCARAVVPISSENGTRQPQGGSSGNTVMNTQPPPSTNLTREISTVTTAASTVQKVLSVHDSQSSRVPPAITTSTFMCSQPRSHSQPDQQHIMSSVLPRGSVGQTGVSCGQNSHQDIWRDTLLAVVRETRHLPSPSGNIYILLSPHFHGNAMNSFVSHVNNGGHQVAARSQSSSDQRVLPFSGLDQNANISAHLPLQSGKVLTDVVILQLSRMIGHKWKFIGIECLGFTSDYLSTIDIEHKDVLTKTFEMFKQWNRNQRGGTIEKLVEVLKKSCDIDPDVYAFMDTLIKSPESTE